MIKIYKIVKSARKTISLIINTKGEILVKAPFYCSNTKILKFVEKHENWILRRIIQIQKQREEYPEKQFIEGEKFLFLGKFYELKFSDNQDEKIILKDNIYISKKYKDKARILLLNYYKKVGFELIRDKIEYYSQRYHFNYNKIKITSAKKRWGSCSYNGNLNFSYRVFMLPEEIIEYIVIHELVHLRVKNHGKKYWENVSRIIPEYKEYHKYLINNKYMLAYNGF